MFIFNTVTRELVTEEVARSLYPEGSLGLTPEGLEGTVLRILPDPEPLAYDPVFYEQTAIVVDNGDDDVYMKFKNSPALNDIELALRTKEAELNLGCNLTIIQNRFFSDALGSRYWYDADQFDQSSIQGNVLFATVALITGSNDVCPHYCYTDPTEIQPSMKVLMEHTPEQMIQVGKDLRQHVLNNVIRCNNLKAQAKVLSTENDYKALATMRW